MEFIIKSALSGLKFKNQEFYEEFNSLQLQVFPEKYLKKDSSLILVLSEFISGTLSDLSENSLPFVRPAPGIIRCAPLS